MAVNGTWYGHPISIYNIRVEVLVNINITIPPNKYMMMRHVSPPTMNDVPRWIVTKQRVLLGH